MKDVLKKLEDAVRLDKSLMSSENIRHFGPFSTPDQFIKSSLKSMQALLTVTKLGKDKSVLDYGCGPGRLAILMSKYLEEGKYLGVDIVKKAIADCKNRFAKYPNFDFSHVNIYNSDYNTEGVKPEQAFTDFKLSHQSDLAFCFSVFSHLLPAEIPPVLNFLHQSLKDDGELFLTMYLFTDYAKNYKGKSKLFNFTHPYEGAFIQLVQNPARAVAYEEDHIYRLFDESGFKIKTHHPGAWIGSKDAVTYQDSFVLIKK